MALDNPSYFTIPGGNTSTVSNKSGGRFSLLRKHIRAGTGSSLSSTSNIFTNKPKKNERYSVLPCTQNMNSPPFSSTPENSLFSLGESKKSFNSLLRSTSFDSPIQTQMFVLGMPRPSDIAPINQHFINRTKKQHIRNASTGKSFKMPDTLGNSRNVKCSDSDSSPNDCALTVDGRYYNVLSGTSFLENGRRHSIGAYFNRKGSSASRPEPQIEEETSFCDDTATANFKFFQDLPLFKKKNTEERSKKKCSCCSNFKGGKAGMEDILIISSTQSQAADLWARYFKTCFDQIRKNRNKPPFRILLLGLEDGGKPKIPVDNFEEKLKNAKLVIFIVCPVFLECATEFPDNISAICKHIRPDGVLAMLLGIKETTINDNHKSAFLSFSQWKRLESMKDRDEKFVGDFLGAAMDLISKNITQQNQSNEKGAFMLMPKKVNKNQNKVLVLLNEPIAKEDAMRVTVIRNNEVFEIFSIKKRNPYTLIFRMPEEFLAVSTLVSIRVERNGTDLGTKLLKCESQLYALVQILKSCDSPVEFMCQALNIVPCDKDKLDDYLVSAFQKNVPPNFNLLQSSGLGHLHKGGVRHDEYPTLLHFAARHGLEKLCWMLLECPGAELACDVRNSCELTPAEIAENSGHTKLSGALSGFMQMTEFTSVYTFLKGMSDDKNNSKSDINDDYLNPRPLSETYQVPPSPRPLALNHSNTPIGYMEMHSPKSTSSVSAFGSQEQGLSKEKFFYRKNSEDNLKRSENERGYKKSKENCGNGIQDELIEIINDFKNNVFTISEVEKLVEDWRNRNDVQQSFREKQEQLNKMREEYEKVQQKLKDEMKQLGRPSPMERIRKFFRSKNKEAKASTNQIGDKKLRQDDNLLPLRPSSGLSIQSSSSSSSGRLSTGSHCSGASLGDSGTHSDAESEQKFRSANCCTISKTKNSLNNYDIPPNPVCLINNKSKASNGMLNYDIPPSPVSSEMGHKPLAISRECDSYTSCNVQSSEVNYYNLIPRDIPIPNQSTLHGRLVGATRNNLQAFEESEENKTEVNNCYEYINLPSVNGNVNSKCLVIKNDDSHVDDTSKLELRLPDYVNVEISNESQ